MSTSVVKAPGTDSTVFVVQQSSTWEGVYTVAMSSTEKSPVRYESADVVYLTFVSEELADEDEARWDKLFAESQDLIEMMADEALAEHRAGLTEELDLDNDFDTV